MAYTQTDLDRVEKAIATGVTTIRHSDGKSVTYRDIDELKAARDVIKKSLSTSRRPRAFVARTHKGL